MAEPANEGQGLERAAGEEREAPGGRERGAGGGEGIDGPLVPHACMHMHMPVVVVSHTTLAVTPLFNVADGGSAGGQAFERWEEEWLPSRAALPQRACMQMKGRKGNSGRHMR